MQYERSAFNKDRGNWVTSKENRKQSFDVQWCSGAPGIGMARLLSLNFDNEPLFSEEVRIAVDTTIKEGFGRNHSLCHGDLGNLDFLIMAKANDHQIELERMITTIYDGLLRSGRLCGNPLN
ncbi:hypothetical protein H1191_07420 [Paenactinomyces guangxiensis]|uniref:Uncharacterized protein n=1 Tax=Paenactinomyces guangxiensis TaxID=1490290 RepID=A0A7W2A8G4_9BACL|nr:hypothetical protein [Paenactinomyces guangxiensis]MBH8591123.1 hypothetical protein [Paenactinomyces guangxiensis]